MLGSCGPLAALSLALSVSGCNAIFGIGPLADSPSGSSGSGGGGGGGSDGGGPCATGSLAITNVSGANIDSFTLDLGDQAATVDARYDAQADETSLVFKTLRVPSPLCSAVLTVVLAGKPMAGKMYPVIPSPSDPRFTIDGDAWVKLDIDSEASCTGPGTWEPKDDVGGPVRVEAFDGRSIKLDFSAVQLYGRSGGAGWLNVAGPAQWLCFDAS